MLKAIKARAASAMFLSPTTIGGLGELIDRTSRCGMSNLVLDYLPNELRAVRKLTLAAEKAGYRTYREDLGSGAFRLYVEWFSRG